MARKHKKPFTDPTLTTTEITGLSHDGRGIAQVNGKITFLLGGLPEEQVEFFYLKKRAQFDEGQVSTVLKPAPNRVQPKCAHFGVCGGCRLQHMERSTQILAKQQILLEQFNHFGRLQPEILLPPLSSQAWGYRHKARLGVKYVHAKQKVLVGFHELQGRYIADIQSCAVMHPILGEKLITLAECIQNLAAFQTIPQIEVAIGDTDAALIFRHLEPLSNEDTEKLSAFGQTHNLHIYLQPGGLNSVHKIWPNDAQTYLHYELPKHKIIIRFHPSDFTQVNPDLNQRMVDQALTLLDPQPQENVLDLFCGLGNFTLPIARYAHSVIGVEGAASLVQRANENAALNQIENAKFYSADLTKDFSLHPWAQAPIDKILLDPPRTGALEVMPFLNKFKAKTIVYVSCNPATLARDSAELIKLGYKLTHAGVMDMFPHTAHVESMARFAR